LWGYPPEIEQRGICLKVSGRGLCIQAFQKGEPVLSNDVLNDADYIGGWPDCRSELAVPLKIGDIVIGVINIESDRPQAFSDKDIHILTTLAGDISILVRNARLFQEQKEKTEQLLVADQINRAIASTLDLNEIFEIVAQGLKKVMEYDGVYFFFYNSKEELFARVYAKGSFDDRNLERLISIPAGDTNMAKVVQTKQSFVCQELKPDEFIRPVQQCLYQIGMRSYVLIPIIDNDGVIGCFNLGSRASHNFGQREVAICQAVANHLAVAIKNSRMYQELKEAYDNLKNAQQTLIDSERLRTLGEITSGVVHDFNNLLATILGRTQILLHKLDATEMPTKDSCLKNLKAMEKAAMDGSQLLTRISQFGKSQSGFKLEPVKVNEVVIDSVELTRPRWKNQSSVEGIKIAVRTEPEGVGEILANPAELREVMMNLIINAVDALPQGGEIVIRTGERKETVWIEVSDNGIGMNPELKDKIFQPFFTTKGKKGSGLGLPICLSIVSRFKGEIKTESKIGKGTIFTLNFPRYSEASPMPIPGRLRQEELVPKN
jgi:signal transduction histidine kinase